MEISHLQKLNKKTVSITSHPERIIQFGTGVLLRGLVDYAVNNANAKGYFKGSIVQIKSTASGGVDEFEEQNQLYTVAIRGFQKGELYQQYELNSSINRTINANAQWQEVLKLARNESLKIIVSNTTEVGITLREQDSLLDMPPVSYPAKLLALLYERYTFFEGDTSKGYIIIPTELISKNGDELKTIVLKLAAINNCDEKFRAWIIEANTFCNSLVDRIVTGKPAVQKLQEHCSQLNYEDKLLIECEPYLLWAIEGSDIVKKELSFALPNSGVIVEPSIEKYKELKLRLLNGTHTFMCGLAFLNGFEYVRDLMKDEKIKQYLTKLLTDEIAPTLQYPLLEVQDFVQAVIDRFANPFIDHKWLSITLNYTQKMAFRNVTNIQRYFNKFNKVPVLMAECFAAYLRFMHPTKQNEKGEWVGEIKEQTYIINDPQASVFYELHKQYSGKEFVTKVLADTDFWHIDLNELEGFADAVAGFYQKNDK